MCEPCRTRAEHYYERGFNDARAGLPPVRPSEPHYVRGYTAGLASLVTP
jgi:hypothetical protein